MKPKISMLINVELWQCGNLVVVLLDEVEDGLTHRGVVDVGMDALHGVEERHVALVDVAVGLGNVVDVFLGEMVLVAHNRGVDTIVDCRVVGKDDERRHVA